MRIIFHKESNLVSIEERRLQEDFLMTPEQRIKKMFGLIKMSLMFRNKEIQHRTSKGIVLKVKKE